MEKKQPKFKTVLVIDDEDIDIFLAEKMLRDENYSENIITFNNAKLALSYIENIKDMSELPDLILLDLNMPAFSGEDFLVSYHQILSGEIRNRIKLVVLTAFKNFHEAKNITVERFSSLIKIMMKPLNVEELEGI